MAPTTTGQQTGNKRNATSSATTSIRPCTAGSATALTRVGGVLMAAAFSVPKTGYKAPNSYGFTPVFDGTTTNKAFVRKFRAAAETTIEHKKLVAYHPLALRNRPRATVTNIVGRRYGVHPSTSTERYKGASSVAFVDPDPEARKPWRTTNQVFSEPRAQVQRMVGLDNPGISSAVAHRVHSKQGIYS